MKTRESKPMKDLSRLINDLWPKLAHGVQVSVLDIPRIFQEIADKTDQGRDLSGLTAAMLEAITKYKKN